jgi:hypothetical protein
MLFFADFDGFFSSSFQWVIGQVCRPLSPQDTDLATKSFILTRDITVLGRDHIRATVRAHPFVQGRKADPQIIRNQAPRKPAGQRYSHRFFAKLIRPVCAHGSSPLVHNT